MNKIHYSLEMILKKLKPIHFFWLGLFLLPSGPILASFFFLISIFSQIKFLPVFLKDKWNYPLIFSVLLMIIGAIYIKYDQSFILQSNELWKSNLLFLGLFNWIPFFWFFWAFQKFIITPRQRYICSVLIISSTIPVLISGFGQYWLEWYGPLKALNGLIIWYQREIDFGSGMTSLFNNQNYAAAWLSIALPFSLGLISFNKKNLIAKFLSIIFFILIFIGLIITHSRSAILCATIALVFHFIMEFRSIKLFYVLSISLTIFGIIMITNNVDFGISDISLDLDRFDRNFDNLDLSRIEIWKYAIRNIIDRPILGWGSGSFPLLINNLSNYWKGHPHNLILELFFSYGILVGFTITAFLYKIYIKSFKKIFYKEKNTQEIIDKYWYCAAFVLMTSQMIDLQYFDFRISFCLWILLAGLKNICTKKTEDFESLT